MAQAHPCAHEDKRDNCHCCGHSLRGSDHCPVCYCEQYESYCDGTPVDECVSCERIEDMRIDMANLTE